MSHKLLYVCYNNKGRSPALEAFTKYFLVKGETDGVVVESAGVGVESIMSLRKKSSQISRMTRHIMRHDYGIDLDHKSIRHLGEVKGDWDHILAVDKDTIEFIEQHSPEYSSRAMLAKEFAGYGHSHSMQIHGPYYHQKDYIHKDWTERLGYDTMLNECKNVSRRIAKKLAG